MVGTSWRVTDIDGQPTADGSPPTVTFDAQIYVTLWTGCREVTASYGLDTDGAALSFWWEGVLPRPDCPDALLAQDGIFLEAIAAIELWSILNRDRIRFEGRHELLLDRL